MGWDARHIDGELHDLHGLGRKIVPVALYVPHKLLGFGVPSERSLIELDGVDGAEGIQKLFQSLEVHVPAGLVAHGLTFAKSMYTFVRRSKTLSSS